MLIFSTSSFGFAFMRCSCRLRFSASSMGVQGLPCRCLGSGGSLNSRPLPAIARANCWIMACCSFATRCCVSIHMVRGGNAITMWTLVRTDRVMVIPVSGCRARMRAM